MGIFCTDMCEHWDRKHNVSSWAHKVAFKKDRINKRGVCCNFGIFFSWQHPHLVDIRGYCIEVYSRFSFACCFSFEEHDEQINSTSWPLFSSLSDERHHAVYLPSAGWKIQAEEHTFSVWDEGKETLPFSDKIANLNVFWLNSDVFLSLSHMRTHTHTHTHTQVSKPVLDNVLNCLRIEVSDITITLSARWASDGQNLEMKRVNLMMTGTRHTSSDPI